MRTWVVLLLLMPLVGASEVGPAAGLYNDPGPADIRLNFHVNGIQDFIINTQAVDPSYSQANALGLATHSQSCIDAPGVPLASSMHHTYYGVAAPGLVQYEGDDYPRYHAERGLVANLRIANETPAVLDWFLETQAIGGDEPTGTSSAVPMVIPNVVVRATWREGDQLTLRRDGLNEGAIVAHGQVGPYTLQPSVSGTGISHHAADGRHVYGFHIPLEYTETTTIRAREGMNVRIDVFIENPFCSDPQGDGYVMADYVRVHTSPDFRPGMDIAIFDPLSVTAVHAAFVDDKALIYANFASPFGAYDVPDATLSGRVLDGDGLLLDASERLCNYHMCQDSQVATTWSWDYAAAGISSGTYFVELTAQNLQGTAQAVTTVGLDIGNQQITACSPDGDVVVCSTSRDASTQTVPGVPFLAALAMLVFLTLRRRGQ